jgi:hypothetical protein
VTSLGSTGDAVVATVTYGITYRHDINELVDIYQFSITLSCPRYALD